MSGIADGYDQAYADKLWGLLPAVYRALDTDEPGAPGPLRELVNRIGAQAANVRRNIDRLWEDQSIETCDDWVIPYIGELLATSLVPGLDSRGQRLDVANTILFRQRKGTVGVLEQIASNITGWDAKVVEFFRRLGRTRHGLDPPIGQALLPGDAVMQLQQAEQLAGAITRTGIGGLADLRSIYGAGNARSAFDEYFYSADLRAGGPATGWYNIPNLGVFVWRLQSFLTGPVTPVAFPVPAGCYSFDPTGRAIPLFTAQRNADTLGDLWVSPQQVQLAAPMTQKMLDANLADPAPVLRLFPNPDVLAVQDAASGLALPAGAVRVFPEQGQFSLDAAPPSAGVTALYCYGFASKIGAGPYDRRVAGLSLPAPAPASFVVAGAAALSPPGAIPPSGTLTIGGSLTCDNAAAVQVVGELTVQASIQARPLIRLGPDEVWVITGEPGASLVLDGLFISGGDVLLAGSFASVTLNCCTFDPGAEAPPGQLLSPPASPGWDGWSLAADERALVPSRLWIEADITSLSVTRCILGPVRPRAGGTVTTASFSETIVQALPDATLGGDGTALNFADGTVGLSRCTVLGPAILHRADISESILRDPVQVDDTQEGCVRFSAWASGSNLPRKYESVAIPAGAGLFTATDFGQPGYCQLLASADAMILSTATAAGAPLPSILAGAADGAEMGAFAREKTPQKLRGLQLKFLEYMPAGLVPVPILVT